MKKIIAILFTVIALTFSFSNFTLAADDACSNMLGGSGSSVCGGSSTNLRETVRNVINTLFWVIGVTSVIVIIYAGILYVISAGNSNTVQKAKSAITYAVVGLIVAILAYAIVNFVIDNITN
ncbi:MAG: hypothetical protein Q4A27_01495 [bacterium]|nr:hypothetical protein [bacterium]